VRLWRNNFEVEDLSLEKLDAADGDKDIVVLEKMRSDLLKQIAEARNPAEKIALRVEGGRNDYGGTRVGIAAPVCPSFCDLSSSAYPTNVRGERLSVFWAEIMKFEAVDVAVRTLTEPTHETSASDGVRV
jgi:hypothetical protein